MAEDIHDILTTDLDGTLIPLDCGCPDFAAALETLRIFSQKPNRRLVFVTGRSFESVVEVIEAAHLPIPHYLLCDVGTSLYHASKQGWEFSEAYAQTLSQRMGDALNERIRSVLAQCKCVTPQEDAHQTPFKISYYALDAPLDDCVTSVHNALRVAGIDYSLIQCADPFSNQGMIDILPRGVSKLFGIEWLLENRQWSRDAVVFAGDSGNDFEALTSGLRAIVVNNAPEPLKSKIRATAAEKSIEDSIFFCSQPATQGVCEGMAHFGLL